MAEAGRQRTIVARLQRVEERERFFLAFRRSVSDRFADKPELHERHEHQRNQQRDHQNDGHRPRKTVDEIVDHAFSRQQEGEERDADGQRSRQNRAEEVFGAFDRSVPARHAFSQTLHIAVDDDDGVIDDHAERHDQCGERHGVQLDAEGVEQPQRDEYRDGNGRGGDQRRADREQQHHHDDYGHDGDHQLLEKGRHAGRNHLALVGDAERRHVLRQGLLKSLQLGIDRLAHLHDVLSFLHFDAQQQAFATVVADIGIRFGILPLHVGDIFQADVVARRRGPYDQLLHVAQRMERLGDIDRRAVLLAIQPAAHRGEALCEQSVWSLNPYCDSRSLSRQTVICSFCMPLTVMRPTLGIRRRRSFRESM